MSQFNSNSFKFHIFSINGVIRNLIYLDYKLKIKLYIYFFKQLYLIYSFFIKIIVKIIFLVI